LQPADKIMLRALEDMRDGNERGRLLAQGAARHRSAVVNRRLRELIG